MNIVVLVVDSLHLDYSGTTSLLAEVGDARNRQPKIRKGLAWRAEWRQAFGCSGLTQNEPEEILAPQRTRAAGGGILS